MLCSRGGHSACRARWCLQGLCRTAYSNNMQSSPRPSNKPSSGNRTQHSHRLGKIKKKIPLSPSVMHFICHSLWFCVFVSQRPSVTIQPQQNPLPAPLYNTMMIPQQSPTNVVQIATSLAQNAGPNTPAVATFAQDRAAQIRFEPSFKTWNQFILMVFCDINLLLRFVQYCGR